MIDITSLDRIFDRGFFFLFVLNLIDKIMLLLNFLLKYYKSFKLNYYEKYPEKAACNDFSFFTRKMISYKVHTEDFGFKLFLPSEYLHLRRAFSDSSKFLAFFYSKVPEEVSLASKKRYLSELAQIYGINLNKVIEFFKTCE